MSIAFERTSTTTTNTGGDWMPPFIGVFSGDLCRFPSSEEEEDLDDSCSSSSSIGKNSDASDGEDSEVESSDKKGKGALDSMDDLQEALPIKRGISKFYHGKSKSFTSLADASSASSIKDFAKPENAYTRKRKNLLARNVFSGKNYNYPPKEDETGISKRPASFNRSTLVLGSTMNSYKCNNKRDDSHPASPPTSSCLPPLYPHGKTSPGNGSCATPPTRNSNWRSFSLSDLQCAANN